MFLQNPVEFKVQLKRAGSEYNHSYPTRAIADWLRDNGHMAPRVDMALVPIGDGLMLARKR